MEDQTKRGSKTHHEENSNGSQLPMPRTRVTGAPPLVPGPGVGLEGERLVAGPFPMGPSRAQPEETTWDPLPVGLPSAGGVMGVGCSVRRAGALAVRSSAADASSRDVERHLAGGKGA